VWSLIQAAGWPIWPLIFASVVALDVEMEQQAIKLVDFAHNERK
jgi:hypothetical protein